MVTTPNCGGHIIITRAHSANRSLLTYNGIPNVRLLSHSAAHHRDTASVVVLSIHVYIQRETCSHLSWVHNSQWIDSLLDFLH